jgi:hypothetical protein
VLTTAQASTLLHRCDGCGGWTLGWCGTCRHLGNAKAVQTILEQAEGRAHRGVLEASLPGTGYQHRPSATWAQPHRGSGAHDLTPRTP